MHFHWDRSEDRALDERINNVYVLKKLAPYFREQARRLGIAFVLLVLSTGCYLALPLILRKIIDEDIRSGNLEMLLTSAAAYLALYAVYVVGGFAQTYVLFRMGVRIITELKVRLFRHILTQELGFFEEYTPGKLLARVESDAENLKQLFSNVSINIFRNIILFFGIFGILFYTDAKTTAIVSVIVPFLVGSTFFFLRFIRKRYQRSRQIYSELTGMITEFTQAVPIIQIYNISRLMRTKLHDKNLERYRVDRTMMVFEYSFWSIFSFAEICAVMIIVGVGGYKVFDGSMTVGTFIMFIEFTRRIFYPILEFSEYINMIQKSIVSASRLFSILDRTPAVLDRTDTKSIGPMANCFEFRNVVFAYEENKPVLNGISFRVPKHKTTAIVGPSGVGKTTIANLCMRFIEQQSGQILYDGSDIRDYARKDWLSLIGLVLQDVYLFPGTVRDNIRALNNEISQAHVENATGIVRATKFIERMPDGYDAILGERGSNISFGERQLLSFARALAINPEILILDEATSSVDPHTERMIQLGIEQLLRGRTSLVIAHRLSTVRRADNIIVLGKDGVVEEGDHKALMDARGVYREMFEAQKMMVGSGT